MLTTVTEADGYLVVEPDQERAAGETVELFLYPWGTRGTRGTRGPWGGRRAGGGG